MKVVGGPVDDTIDYRWIRKREAVMRNPFMFMSVFTAPGIDDRTLDDHREVSDRSVEQYRMMRRGIAFESAMSEARTHGLR